MSDELKASPGILSWTFSGTTWRLGGFPRLMGIVNVTPDSFSDGGTILDPARAADHAVQLLADGADIIDIGGESTRPGATPTSDEEELTRIIPVIERIVRTTAAVISVDTRRSAVARRALDAGAVIVNDVSGLSFDPAMPSVCARSGAGIICMHMQGTPQTMQLDPQYADVVGEITAYLAGRLDALEQAGIPRERVVVDPGIGFGKTAAHNLSILQNIERFRSLGRPVLVGHSRKRFLGKLLGRPIDELSAGTIGVSIALALQGTDLLRVHDVAATRDALAACWKLIQDGPFET
jgi:dihydropteroate synthase